VWQSAYGHLANKATWLYYYGENPPMELDWRRIVGTHQVAYPPKEGTASRNSKKPALTRKKANATPEPFRDVMIALASESQREAAESADEKSDGQAENA